MRVPNSRIAIAEIVVEHGRRNCGRQAHRRRDQRLRDSRAPQRAGSRYPPWPRDPNAEMMPHTVPNSPINGDTVAVVASQFMLRSSRATSSLMPSCSVRSSASLLVTVPRAFTCRSTLAVAEIEHGHQRRDAELLARDRDRIHAVRLAEGAQKLRVCAARIAEPRPFGKDDGPGQQRQDEKYREHCPGHRPGVQYRVSNADLQKK